MLCLLIVWNLRNFKLIVKDNVRSGCYWYADDRTGVCIEGMLYSLHIFHTFYIRTWADTLLVHYQGHSQGLKQGRVEVEACVFFVLW